MEKITIADQVRAVQRELAMRERLYPTWITMGKITQEKADHEIASMRAVLASVVGLSANEVSVERQGLKILEYAHRWQHHAPLILKLGKAWTLNEKNEVNSLTLGYTMNLNPAVPILVVNAAFDEAWRIRELEVTT